MPSDYNQPLLTTGYASFLSTLKDRDVDAITLCLADPSNKPTGTIRYLRASNKFQEWDGSNWQDKILDLAGGGTGGSSAAGARTSLGLGSMAVQDSTAVNIVGGTLAGNGSGLTSLNASNLASGTAPTARLGSGTANSSSYLRGDSSWAVIISFPTYAANQSADFSATVETAYNLTGSHTVTLPTVVGNGSKRVALVNFGTGGWTVAAAGGETILGGATWDFSFGQYSAALLVADANNAKWDVF